MSKLFFALMVVSLSTASGETIKRLPLRNRVARR